MKDRRHCVATNIMCSLPLSRPLQANIQTTPSPAIPVYYSTWVIKGRAEKKISQTGSKIHFEKDLWLASLAPGISYPRLAKFQSDAARNSETAQPLCWSICFDIFMCQNQEKIYIYLKPSCSDLAKKSPNVHIPSSPSSFLMSKIIFCPEKIQKTIYWQ